MSNQTNNQPPKPNTPAAPSMPPTQDAILGRMISEAVAKALTEALPMSAAMLAKVQAETMMRGAQRAQVSTERCPDCNQLVTVRTFETMEGERKQTKSFACGGEHEEIVIWPMDPKARTFFPGVFINGVGYKSSHPGHKVMVPRANAITHTTQLFEKNEYEINNPRVANHDSGSISMSAGKVGFNPAYQAWR